MKLPHKDVYQRKGPAPKGVEVPLERQPGLPHGRLWVAEKGCTCALCTARLAEETSSAETMRRYKKRAKDGRKAIELGSRIGKAEPYRTETYTFTKLLGRWAVVGPEGTLTEGARVTVSLKGGRTKVVTIAAEGPLVTINGIAMSSGFTRD